LPSTPYDAKGLLKTAIRDENPIVFFEDKTESLILNSMWALLSHWEQLEEVRSNSGLISGVIEESLRWEPPVQGARDL
jgi:hypothetical protein